MLLLIFCIFVFTLPLTSINAETTTTVGTEPTEDVGTEPVDTSFSLNDVVVTATRTPKLLKDVPIQTQVITSKDIERADASNIQELLGQELPGVEFSYAMNQQMHINFSGFSGQNVLFLVDGERLSGENLDNIDFTRLNMNDVDHIEIVKGAASALYGSNAGGGVINIITKKNCEPWQLNVNTRLARHGDRRHAVNLGFAGNKLSNATYFNFRRCDNFNVDNAPNPPAHVFSTVYGEKTYSIKDKLTFRPNERLTLTGRAAYFFRTLHRTADTPERYRDFAGGLRALWEISPNDNLEAAYSFDQYDKSDYQTITGLDIRDYSNVQNTVRALYSHRFGRQAILTAGADYMHDYLYNVQLDGNVRRQDSFDAFAQADWTVNDHWELVAAMRYDYFSIRKDSRLTPKLAVRFSPTANINLRLSYGMGFRAPSLKELYYNFDMAGIWIVRGNDKLKSEVSHNFNISMEWTKDNYAFTLSGHYNNVTDKLATGSPHYSYPPTTTMPNTRSNLYLDYMNLDTYSVYGAEAIAQAYWSCGLSAKLSYAFTKEHLPQAKDAGEIGSQYIPAREHHLGVWLEWNRQFTSNYGLTVSMSGRFLSGVTNKEFTDYYDVSKGTTDVRYPAYTTWKLSTRQHIGKAICLTLALDNIFNYRPRFYYFNSPPTDGINLQAGISIDIEKLF